MYSFLLVQGWVILFDATARCHVTLPPLYTTNHSSQSPQSKAHFHLNESPCHFDCINFAHHFNGTPFYLLLALNPSHNAWWWSNLTIATFPMGFLILSKTFVNGFFLKLFLKCTLGDITILHFLARLKSLVNMVIPSSNFD